MNDNLSTAFSNFTSVIDNSFYFVVDKIIDLQKFFIDQAYSIGRIVLLIALLSAGLNYALTGNGFKENLIKIMKATLFFLIVTAAYPKIIGWISSYTIDLARNSIYKSVSDYFGETVEEVHQRISVSVGSDAQHAVWSNTSWDQKHGSYYKHFDTVFFTQSENSRLFSDLVIDRKHPQMSYSIVSPANAVKIVMFMASRCMSYADDKENKIIPEFSRVFKGLICAFFLIFTGIFAIMEYLICFLEFILVSTVGVILFPLSIWEGSKFMSEKYIGAIVGFFMKLLFCNIAIFLMLYGYISLYSLFGTPDFEFKGTIDQIATIAFISLLFFLICKSAPALAQSLLTGTPSLNAAGAIGAVSGAVGAAAATAGLAQKAGGAIANTAGSVVGGGARLGGGIVGSLAEANAAKKSAMSAVADAGGTVKQQEQAGTKAFRSSIGSDIGDSIKSGALGLARSISGDKNGGSSGGGGGTNPHSWRDAFNSSRNDDGSSQTIKQHLDERRGEGAGRGVESAKKFISQRNSLNEKSKKNTNGDGI